MAERKFFPLFLRAVTKPSDAPASEIAKARPVYIDGLPTVQVTKAEFDALVARVEALEP